MKYSIYIDGHLVGEAANPEESARVVADYRKREAEVKETAQTIARFLLAGWEIVIRRPEAQQEDTR